jgi:hypothetical protein
MDDLTRIKGIGPAAAKRLAQAGIDSFEKLAHDGIAGQNGIKVEWISEAAELLLAAANEDTEGKPPRPDLGAEGSAEAPALPADSGAGDPQQDNPVSEDRGSGSGDPAVPARERRRFPVNWALMHDGRLVEEHGKVELTLVEHEKLASGVISAPWLSGEPVE